MILYPNLYIKSILNLDIETLKKNNIQGLLLDLDNTLIDYNINVLKGLEEWILEQKNNNIKIAILSNTGNKKKVEKVANLLNIPYLYFAKKPFLAGFKRGKNLLDLPYENIGVVGDQVFTDILGANRLKMFSILVEPVDRKEMFVTFIKRPLEDYIIRKYQKIKNGGKNVYK